MKNRKIKVVKITFYDRTVGVFPSQAGKTGRLLKTGWLKSSSGQQVIVFVKNFSPAWVAYSGLHDPI